MQNEQQNITYSQRIQSIDLLRGLVLIIMALDHTRDYFGPVQFSALDVSQTSLGLFFTRWITHLCAPTFVLLTGISAYLYGAKHTRGQLSGFLLKRGLWLIFLELVVVSFSWKFTFHGPMILQVIWALGASMIVLSVMVWLPLPVILAFSLLMLFGHNSFDSFTPASESLFGKIWLFLHAPPSMYLPFRIGYPLIPWPAVMAFGYCLGTWFNLSQANRSKRFVYLGLGCLLLFIGLRYFNFYGDPYPWQIQARGDLFTFLSFINVNKYPASLQYLLLMLGMVFILWPYYETWHGRASRIVLCFGKVSLFFYLIHLPVIHLAGIIYSDYFLHYPAGWWWGINLWNAVPWPSHYQLNLPLVYMVWLLILLMLLPFCYWYKTFKSRHNYWWLSYI